MIDSMILGFLSPLFMRSREYEVFFVLMISDLDLERSIESLPSSFLQESKQLETRLPFLELFLHLRLDMSCMHVKVAPLCDF